MDRRSLFGALALVASAAACSAADSSKPSLVVVQCEPGAANCSGEAARKPSGGNTGNTDTSTGDLTSGGGSPFDSGTTPPPPTDAGVLGMACSKLKVCCAALTAAKQTGDARQCNETADLKGESGCAALHKDLQTPGDYYDPPAGCL